MKKEKTQEYRLRGFKVRFWQESKSFAEKLANSVSLLSMF
jgi:hypothetical protein